jgi:prepilin-type N-terminal cleavage/methylation domain-containing protein
MMNLTVPIPKLGRITPCAPGIEHGTHEAHELTSPTFAIAGAAFTLIEIMVVVAILGIVLATSIPAINSIRKRAPMVQTVKELREVFSNARARAIFDGSTKQVVFRPFDRTFALSGAGGDGGGGGKPKGAGLSGTFDDRLSVEMLDVNLMEFKDQELAVVNFYPNGTCDELTIVLRSDQNEWRKLTLEVTTALSTVGPVQ